MLQDRIRGFRERFGMSQEELAERIGVARQTVTKWETGAGLPDVNNAVELALAFRVSVDELLGVKRQGQSGREGLDDPGPVFCFPQVCPEHSIRKLETGISFTTWREIDGRHCLRRPGDVECYGVYRTPGWTLDSVQQYSAISRASFEETEGIWIDHKAYSSDGFLRVRSFEYQAQLGDVILPITVELEHVLNNHVQLYRYPSGELRREAQQAWTIPWRQMEMEMVEHPDDLPLRSHSTEHQFPGFSSWKEHEFEIDGAPMAFMGVAGLYEVAFDGTAHQCTRLVRGGFMHNDTWAAEYYITRQGRTVLKRTFGMGSNAGGSRSGNECVYLNGTELGLRSIELCTMSLLGRGCGEQL